MALASVFRLPSSVRMMKVAVVGVCASGKSTLASALKQFGIEAVDVAQEHSLVPHMWQVITRPDVLIYLDASQETVRARWPFKGDVDFVDEQARRLKHARAHADLIVAVDHLNERQVLALVLSKLDEIHEHRSV